MVKDISCGPLATHPVSEQDAMWIRSVCGSGTLRRCLDTVSVDAIGDLVES